MEYKLGNIIFSKDKQYDRVTWWNLYRIFYALEHPTKDLKYASCVTGEYGLLLFKGIADDKTILGVEEKNIIDRYYERIIKSIPQSILEKIQNIELFKLGYLEKNIYDELMIFKNELRDWLENPPGSNQHFVIDDNNQLLSHLIHDQVFTTIRKNDKQLEFIGDEYIVCSNCKTIIIDNNNERIIDDYQKEEDYIFNYIEGYTTYPSVVLEKSGKHIFFLELNSEEISEMIIETDSVKGITLMGAMLKQLTSRGWIERKEEFLPADLFEDITHEYFANVVDCCNWPFLFRHPNKWESDNYLIINKKYIKGNNLQKEFDPKKYIPLIKNKRDESYYVFAKEQEKVLNTKENKIVADSILDFILKIIADEIKL